MRSRNGFGALPFVAIATFHSTRYGETDARLKFMNEWARDNTVTVRAFNRVVRAGGAEDHVVTVVVRRKAAK